MYIHPKTLKQREYLLEDLQALKADGYRAFISKDESYVYGMVTDGKHFVSLSGAPYGMGLTLSYNYVPTKGHGCCIGSKDMDPLLGKVTITKQDVETCIQYGYGYAQSHGIRLYTNLEHFMNRGNRDRYEEVA